MGNAKLDSSATFKHIFYSRRQKSWDTCISGAFSNSHVPNPFSHPTNNVGCMYPKFFPSFNFVWVGEGTNEENFEKVALFYERTQILQKIANTALLSQHLSLYMFLFVWCNCGNCRCCCGRRENQHGKLTIVEEENEEAEASKEAEEEETESSSENEDEVVQSEERVKLGGRGLY